MTTDDIEIHKGLDGVFVDETAISMVNEATNSLLYRGYPAPELAEKVSFEEVAYLIWHGELPNARELEAFVATERNARDVVPDLIDFLGRLPLEAHPMDIVRTAVSFLGAADPRAADSSVEANLAKSLDLLAKLPTIVAFDERRRRGLAPIAPDPSLGYAENFFHMCFGSVPEPEIVSAFSVSLVLYAEHSFNASTFTARVVASTLADLHSAVVAAIGALKGPLHGGANEAVMEMIDEISGPEVAERYLLDALASHRVVMGFGHRVYKHGDSRVPTMQRALRQTAAVRDGARLVAIADVLEQVMAREKAIYPNLDFPAGPAYHLMGFSTRAFTPIFVMSRITGWTAHIIEQLGANALIRPLSRYVGPDERPVPADR